MAKTSRIPPLAKPSRKMRLAVRKTETPVIEAKDDETYEVKLVASMTLPGKESAKRMTRQVSYNHFSKARYDVGETVRHRLFGFTGVIYDVDPVFSNSEEWYKSIPRQLRPSKNQPFYHILAVTRDDEEPYMAYVSEQNLEAFDAGPDGIPNPEIASHFKKHNGRLIRHDRLN